MIPKFTTDVHNITSLPDQVNNQASWLKGIFDKSSSDLKNYLNNVLTVAIDNLNLINLIRSENVTNFRANAQGVLEMSSDGTNWKKVGGSFTILGVYPTLIALQTAKPTGNIGDAYSVGSAAIKDVYIWSGAWVNIGQIQGATGVGVASGGTTGQILAKSSNNDYETQWRSLVASMIVDTVLNKTQAEINQQINQLAGTQGTALPSGGVDGDRYFRYI